MTIIATDFRTNFPEFASTAQYPDAQVNFYLSLAYLALSNTQAWGMLQDYGVQWFVAHNLVLFAQRARAASVPGGIPGATQGPLASKAVDKVSIGYDVQAGVLEGGGAWNLTSYGVEFLQLARLVGSSGVRQL